MPEKNIMPVKDLKTVMRLVFEHMKRSYEEDTVMQCGHVDVDDVDDMKGLPEFEPWSDNEDEMKSVPDLPPWPWGDNQQEIHHVPAMSAQSPLSLGDDEEKIEMHEIPDLELAPWSWSDNEEDSIDVPEVVPWPWVIANHIAVVDVDGDDDDLVMWPYPAPGA